MARSHLTFPLLRVTSLNLPPNAASTIATAFYDVCCASRTKGNSKPINDFSSCESAAAHKTGEADKNDAGVKGVRYCGTKRGRRGAGAAARLLLCRGASMSDVPLLDSERQKQEGCAVRH